MSHLFKVLRQDLTDKQEHRTQPQAFKLNGELSRRKTLMYKYASTPKDG